MAFLFHLAPMQCYTNSHFRYFVRLLTEKAILWTEMEKTEDLLRSDKDSKKRLGHSAEEHPLVLQLGGDDVLAMQRILERETRLYGPFDEININAGCPSIQAGGANYGASLMLRADHTRALVETLAHERQQPVSVKCRIGTYALPQQAYNDDYNTLHEFVHSVSKSSCLDHIVVHARAAVLAGLSPAKNRNVPPLRYDYVHRLAQEFPSLRVTMNGGLSLKQVLAASSSSSSSINNNDKHCDFISGRNVDVMVGRDALSNILDLWHIDACEHVEHWHLCNSKAKASNNNNNNNNNNNKKTGKAATRAIAIRRYGEYATRQLEEDDSIVLAELLLPLVLACEHLRAKVEEEEDEEENRGQAAVHIEEEVEACCQVVEMILGKGRRSGVSSSSSNEGEMRRGEEELATLQDVRGELKRLSKRMKAAIGVKVMNKIIRNREE